MYFGIFSSNSNSSSSNLTVLLPHYFVHCPNIPGQTSIFLLDANPCPVQSASTSKLFLSSLNLCPDTKSFHGIPKQIEITWQQTGTVCGMSLGYSES